MDIDPSRLIATGIWLYDCTVRCKVVVQKEDVWPAFFDPEDDPNAEDRVMPCVSVWYENPGGGRTFNAGGGYYRTLEEAKEAVQKILPSPVDWKISMPNQAVEATADPPSS